MVELEIVGEIHDMMSEREMAKGVSKLMRRTMEMCVCDFAKVSWKHGDVAR